ncbi:MAG: hypothetical protein KC731_13175 [Myxococcales bacterium]|nr:hypothetical protein [Myxococcales bacterium]
MLQRLALLVLLLSGLAGCATAPPSGWQQGGAPLVVPRARWVNGDVLVDVDTDGVVTLGGKHLLTVDRAGRVYDLENEPIALLDAKGYVHGPDDKPMGWVGAGEAVLPGGEGSWLMMDATGLVVRRSGDGDRPFGQWLGCGYAQTVQTCMLISHIVGAQILEAQRSRPRVGVGIGIGVGFRP